MLAEVMVTPITAIILSFVYVYLGVRVIILRNYYQTTIGDGDHLALQRAIAAHRNFNEYVPITIIIMGLNEVSGAMEEYLTLIAVIFVAARVIHAYNISSRNERLALRVLTTGITFATIILLGLALMSQKI